MATDTANASCMNPEQECDLIMKGGATSGLVYPPAVLALKDQYVFRNIGGTSAGAVAAAFTAAAEYNRHGKVSGFEKLRQINLKLQGLDAGAQQSGTGPSANPVTEPTYLVDLFQGTRATQPLLNIFKRMAEYIRTIKRIELKAGRLSRIGTCLGLVWSIVKDSKVPGVWTGALYGALVGVLLAAVLTGIIGVLSWWMTGSWIGLRWALAVLGTFFGLTSLVLGGLAGGLYRLFRIAVTEVPRNKFGICNGLNDPENDRYRDKPAVMQWLHNSIQDIAGRSLTEADKVLTFSDLVGPDPKDPKIKLEVMVTNVSEGRPYVLPFDEPFIFRKQDFDKLFPEPIVTRLTGNARTIAGIKLPKEKGYYFLPKGDDLPVAVAARMSMSFPLLFSSVPLYALPLWARELIEPDAKGKNYCLNIESAPIQVPPQSLCELTVGGTPAADPKHLKSALQKKKRWDDDAKAYAPKPEDLIPHWFSDGGIASNFPIHFFDQWLPKSPTFGITLRYLPDYSDEERANRNYLDSMESSKGPEERNIGKKIRVAQTSPKVARPDLVVLPGPEDAVPLEWQHILYPDTAEPRLGAVPGFLGAVIKTMQNYRDNSQAGLPSYRERVAQVRLKPDEGGFNLAMGTEAIKGVVEKGQSAGQKLNRDFNKKHHQWARLRVLISELDAKFRKIRDDKRDVEFEELVKVQQTNAGYPFREPSADWVLEVTNRVQTLRTAMDSWKVHPETVHLEAGTPPPVLRVTPGV